MRGLAAVMICATPAVAQSISLIPPVDCVVGETCYIQNYFDHDPGPATVDFTCASLSYNGHDGTDFALPHLADQVNGVNVIAAAAGEVLAVRDSMPDILQGNTGAPDITGRECGNGVVIRHIDGWETQYCHLALGSIRVQNGEQVDQGDILGRIGLSGQSEFPHVHFTVRHHGDVIDPFDSDPAETCGAPDTALWASALPYQAGGLLSIGFSSAVPEYEVIKSGQTHDVLTAQSPGMVLWGFAFGGRAGDLLLITITGPDGEIIEQPDILDRDQAQFFRAAGKRTAPDGWPVGDYTGTVELIRDHIIIDAMTLQMTLQ